MNNNKNYISNIEIENSYLDWFYKTKKRSTEPLEFSKFINQLDETYDNAKTSVSIWRSDSQDRFLKIKRNLYIDLCLQPFLGLSYTSEISFRNDVSLLSNLRINDSIYPKRKGVQITSIKGKEKSKYEKKLNKSTKVLFELLYLTDHYTSIKKYLLDIKNFIVRFGLKFDNISNFSGIKKVIKKEINLIYDVFSGGYYSE